MSDTALVPPAVPPGSESLAADTDDGLGPDVVVRARGLSKVFGKRHAVNNLDLTVRSMEVFGFLGPNGSGKSTTIRMMLGLISPTEGDVRVMGHDIRSHKVQALARVGAQVETPAFYTYLSGLRNLQLLSGLTHPVPRSRIEEVLHLVRLKGRERDKVKTYSQGMRARLGLAQALLPRPDLLILDEPTNGLDPQGMKEVRDLIRMLAHEDRMTVFLSSHLLAEVQHLCDRVAVIDRGRMVAQGEVRSLLQFEGPEQVTIACRPRPIAENVARRFNGVHSVNTDADGLVVMMDRDRIGPLNTALVQAGVEVSELVRLKRTLEDFFLTVTSDQGPGEPEITLDRPRPETPAPAAEAREG